MGDIHDDFPDAEWTGRPKDDPELIAMQNAARAKFRREHPPVNCWIDGVTIVELYLDGVVRARVERFQSLRLSYSETWVLRGH